MKFNVEKSITIDAPVATVRSYVEDFNRWNDWSPWTICEPGCPVEVSGSVNEPGHSMSWDGEIIGSGRNTIKTTDNDAIHYDLEFFKPWKSQAKTSFLFENLGHQTKVTWTMDSSMPFFMFFMIKTMRNWIGMDYERGLRMLKEMAEKGKVEAVTTNKGTMDYVGFSYVGIQRSVSFADMSGTMQKDFEKLVDDIVVKGGKSAKHWVCIYSKFDLKNLAVTYIAAVSDEEAKTLELGSDYIKGTIPDSKALEIKHDGSYEFLGNAWSMGMMYLNKKKIKQKNFPFEQYWNSPMETRPEDLETSVYFPLKA